MHALVFGNVAVIMQRAYARRFSYDIQNQELRDFCRIYNVPRLLKAKMVDFFLTLWNVHRGINRDKARARNARAISS